MEAVVKIIRALKSKITNLIHLIKWRPISRKRILNSTEKPNDNVIDVMHGRV